MKATAKLLTWCVLLGIVSPASRAMAGSGTLPSLAMHGAAAVGQRGGEAQPDRRQEADELLRQARQAMKEGKLDLAESLVDRAERLGVQYDALFARFADTPAKVRQELDDLRRRSGQRTANEMPNDPYPATKPEPRAASPAAGQTAAGGHPDLLAARLALAAGDIRQAGELVERARRSGATFSVQGDSPDKVQDLLHRHQQLATQPPAADQQGEYARRYAQTLMDQAEGLLPYGEVQQAKRLVEQARRMPAQYGPYERTPDQLLQRIAGVEQQLAAQSPAAPNRLMIDPQVAPAGAAGPLGAAPLNRPETQPFKEQSLRLVAQAKAALDRGDIAAARRFADQAQELRIPDSAFGPNETRPWEIMLEIDSAARLRGPDVVRAIGYEDEEPNGHYPVAQSIYDPNSDATRMSLAQAEEQSSRRLPPPGVPQGPLAPGPLTPLAPGQPPQGGPSQGEQLYQQGIQALQQQNRQVALELFQQAWQFQAELDPHTRQQLKDKLTLLRAASQATPPAGQGSPALEQIESRQQVLQQRLYREIVQEQAAAERDRERDPRGGLQRLEAVRDRVNQAELDPESRKQLLAIVDRAINSQRAYIDANRGDIELNERNAAILSDIEQGREQTIEVQQKVAELVDQFNKLMDEGRYAEAEAIAKQAYELAPELDVVQNLMWKSRFARRIQEQMVITDEKAVGFDAALTSVEQSGIPFDDRVPLVFDVRNWKDLTNRRKAMDQNERRMSPIEREIYTSLSKQVEVSFHERPLRDVMDELGAITGVNIHLDMQGLGAEGITTDTPVTLNLKQPISLRSALNLILDQLRLSYVIDNEVLLITSAQNRNKDTYTKVYNVADLVIPIPNFVPSSNIGLPGAIRDAHNALGYGMPVGGSGTAPLTLAENGGAAANASILAQMASSGMLRGMGSRPPQAMGMPHAGPGGAAAADFDSLIQLIQTTVEPDSWDAVGGPGAIEPFATNLSLVVSQTQEVHDQIADLLEQLRRLQDLQVTIEVRFMTLNDRFFERIGIDFDFDIDDNVTIPPDEIADLDDTGPSVTVGLEPDGLPTADLDLSFSQDSFGAAVPQFGGFDAATAANFGFAILSDIEVFFLLQAAQGDTRSNVLQAPKVTLFNGQLASIFDVSQRPFVTSVVPVVGDFAAAHQPVIVVLSEGTSLSVQAVVSSDRRFVRLTLVPFFSRIGEVEEFTFTGKTTSDSGTNIIDDDGNNKGVNNRSTTTEGVTVQLPTFAFTTVNTTVSVPDGGTVLLGGIKRLSEGRTERGVPMLSKLPWINRLFRNVGIGRETQSLMMMVTPRIIIQEEEEEKLGIATSP